VEPGAVLARLQRDFGLITEDASFSAQLNGTHEPAAAGEPGTNGVVPPVETAESHAESASEPAAPPETPEPPAEVLQQRAG